MSELSEGLAEVRRAIDANTDALKGVGEAFDRVVEALNDMGQGIAQTIHDVLTDEDGDPILEQVAFALGNAPIYMPPADADGNEGTFVLTSDVWAQRALDEAQAEEPKPEPTMPKRKSRMEEPQGPTTESVPMEQTTAGWEGNPAKEPTEAEFRVEES